MTPPESPADRGTGDDHPDTTPEDARGDGIDDDRSPDIGDDEIPSDISGDDFPEDIDIDAAARGAVYTLAARTFDDPDEDLYRDLARGAVDEQIRALVDRTSLDVAPPDLTVEDDRETLSARYNDLFVVGYSEVVDKTDGTIDSRGPPVSLYESDYRSEVSWNDVNLDLARAYEYFGLGVNRDERRNHDHLRLQLEFMGFLCRREAAVDPDVAAARLDFHDRHLREFVPGVAGALECEPGTGLYGRLASFLDRFTEADVEDLAGRRGSGPT